MQSFTHLDVLRHTPTEALLALFYGQRATQALANAGGSLQRLLAKSEQTGGRRLLAAQELVRRALYEALGENAVLSSPTAVRSFLVAHFALLEAEHFISVWVNSQNRLLGLDELFRGTLAQTSVYPREVVKHGLARNAAGVVFAHNHPSGVAEPSRADELLTQSLKQALGLVDIKVLDHFVVAGGAAISFAERGLL